MPTPLYPTFRKRVADAVEQLIRQQVTPWSFMAAGPPFRIKHFDGRQIAYEGITFDGSPREVFWSRYIEPFLEELCVSEIAAAVSMAREKQVDGKILLPELQALLSAGFLKVYRTMAYVDRRLRGKGYPENVNIRPINEKLRAMEEFLDERIHSEIVMWKPKSLKVKVTDSERMTGKATDRQFMLKAIDLARKCMSETGKISPKVGAIIAREGKAFGKAFRGELAPGEHAEFTLLERKLSEKTLAGATLFTTLEPCTSRNHPKVACADRIIERRIKRVFIGMLDPNDRIRGRGELRLRAAGIEIARFDPDLMPKIEELNRDFMREHAAKFRRRRTKAETADPVKAGELGPNGHRIGYTKNGDKVEWIPDEVNPGKEWPLLLRRNDKSILKTLNEFWDRAWWKRHQAWLKRIKGGEEQLTVEQKPILKKAMQAAKRIEKKYGKKNLGWDEFEWELLSGRMSSLAWVMGAEWDESLDT